MKRLLLSTVLTLSLSGCLLPSGVNPTLGCSPFTGCQQKDFYLPGRGYWAPKPMFKQKATYATIGGAALGASLGKDPVTAAVYGTIGLVIGYVIGDTIDKVDQLHAAMAINQSFNRGEPVSWRNKKGNFSVTNTPAALYGVCREFITDMVVNGENKQMRGTACKNNKGEWIMKEAY